MKFCKNVLICTTLHQGDLCKLALLLRYVNVAKKLLSITEAAIVVFVFNRKRNMRGVNCCFSFPLPTSCRLAVRNNLKKVRNYWKSPVFCLKNMGNLMQEYQLSHGISNSRCQLLVFGTKTYSSA